MRQKRLRVRVETVEPDGFVVRRIACVSRGKPMLKAKIDASEAKKRTDRSQDREHGGFILLARD